MKHRLLTTLAVLLVASGANAFDATLTFDQPNVVIDRLNLGQTTAVVSGRCDIREGFNSLVLWIPYAYRSGSYQHRNDYTLSQGFLNWLGIWETHISGGVYNGPLFEIQMDSNDIGGLYNHQGTGLTHPPMCYLYKNGNIMDRSNETPYTITYITPGRVTAHVTLGDWYLPLEEQYVEVIVRHDGIDDVDYVPLDANGSFELETLLSGTAEILVRGEHWIRQSSGPVTLGQPIDLNFSLSNGDCNYDNEVGIGDFALISAGFNTSIEDEGYVYGADLNGDFFIDIGDYSILSSNYGLIGDE